jgi:hypothetical protein
MDSPYYPVNDSTVLTGEALMIGELYWPRPDPPLLPERAGLVAGVIPHRTLASGVTAGWVWSGLGLPTPFALVALKNPSPSPLLRHEWKIRSRGVEASDIRVLAGLTLLSRQATVTDLWRGEASDEVAAAQLFFLHPADRDPPQGALSRRVELVRTWRENYPWATR